MKRSYAALMTLYPPEYRGLFADEMAAVFEEASRDRRTHGWGSYVTFLVIEVVGLMHGAAMEWGRRSSQRPSHRVFTFLAGGMITLLFLGPLLRLPRFLPSGARPRVMPLANDEAVALMVLAATSVVLIAAFSIAFVINLRSIAHRRQSKA